MTSPSYDAFLASSKRTELMSQDEISTITHDIVVLVGLRFDKAGLCVVAAAPTQ